MSLRRIALTSLASYGVPVLIGLVAMPIAFRLLGASMFGVLAIALLAPALAASLDLGITSGAVRRLAMELEQRSPSLGQTLGSYSVALLLVGVGLGTAVALAAPLLVNWLDFSSVVGKDAAMRLIYLCAAWMTVSLAMALPSIVLRARQRFGELALIQTVSTLALWAAAIALAARERDVLPIVAAAALITVASSVACLVVARNEFPKGTRLQVRAALVVEDSRFSSGLFLVQLSNVVAFQLDRVMVAALASPAAAGVYALCVGIANKTLFAISALTSFTYPRVAAMRASGSENQIGALLQAVLRVALVIVAPLMAPALMLAGPFLALWLHTTDPQSVTLLRLLFVGYAIAALCAPATHVFTGTGTSRLAAIFAWVTATLLLAGMVVFVPSLGVVGAGMANVLALASSLVFVTIVRARLQAPAEPGRRRLLTGVTLGVVAQIIVLAVLAPRVDSWMMFLIAGTASLVAYQAVRWAMRSISGEEERLLKSVVSRLRPTVDPPP